MKTFVKNYIGKGKKVEGLEIIKINFKIADLVKFSHKYKDEDYVSIEIAKLKTPDAFGHDYTAYVNRLEESPEKADANVEKSPAKPRKKAKKAEEPSSQDDIPF